MDRQRAELRRIGELATPVAVIDDFTGEVEAAIDLAAALGPLPAAKGSLYPGLRRVITASDADADAFVARSMELAAPYVAGAYGVDRFTLIEASFSMVTVPPEQLVPPQRAPHFDSTEPDHVALLLYLNLPWPTGTAFFRHRATSVERIDEANVDRFVAAARAEANLPDAARGYVAGTNRWYDEIGAVEAAPDRMLIYPGGLLHSGMIPADVALDPNPRTGRLTANFFIKLQRSDA